MPKPEDIRKPVPSQHSESTLPSAELALPVSFEELAGGKKEVQIEHHGQVYRLRATRNGGLILNK